MLQTGFWQIIEMFTIFWMISSAIKNHGKPLFSEEEINKYCAEDMKSSFYFVGFIMNLILGPILAHLGGATGVWYLAYSAVCFVNYLYVIYKIDTVPPSMIPKHSIVKTVLLASIYTYLLYLSGFWWR